MHRNLQNLFKLTAIIAPAALLLACGSGGGGTGGNGAGGSSTHSTSSGSTSTSTSTSSSGSTSTSTSSSSTSTSTSSGSAMAACQDSADQAALAQHSSTIGDDAKNCELSNLTDMSMVSPCIQQKDGLSKACADCFASYTNCGAQKCLTQCSGSDQTACNMCLDMNCTPAFTSCSGINPNQGGDAGVGDGG